MSSQNQATPWPQSQIIPKDWNKVPPPPKKRPSTALPQPILLLGILALLTFYRLWVIPRLGVTLYIDEAQYWTWAQNLDWGYFSKPPVIAWLIALSTALFGDGLLAVKLPSLLLYPATAWLLFLLGKNLFDVRIGFRTGLSFALIPIVSALGLAVSTDAPLMFFWTAAMLCLLRAIKGDHWSDWLLLGAAVGLGIMSKYTMAAFGASALLYLALDPVRRRVLTRPKLWCAVTLAALLVLPNILWNWSHDFPTLRHTAEITHVEGMNDKSGNFGEFLLAQIGSLGPAFAIAFVGGLVLAFKRWHKPRYQFLLCFSLPLLGLVFIQALRSQANGNWAAPALLTALMLACVWLARLRLRWWAIALGINIAIMLIAYHEQDILHVAGKPMTAHIDPLKRAKGWDKLANAIRPILVRYPDAVILAEDRTVMAHMLYQLRGLKRDFAAWAPHTHAADHYQLTIPLPEEHTLRPVLLITQSDDISVNQRFTEHQMLAKVAVEVEPGLRREATIWLLQGFMGYR
ncbi:glycosyltransferase family 39 protein [Uliginosibacterium gangwonense]|uniref:glycosyltransferase family 39 protein n=1 Tax=Uliginosibacterium gangwonense TaxID=392736 RepID=UPI00036C17D2|nr:glycosyltransferase family 39 protein [Uliginosibacterium gangwonense]